jgi:spore coat protein JB
LEDIVKYADRLSRIAVPGAAAKNAKKTPPAPPTPPTPPVAQGIPRSADGGEDCDYRDGSLPACAPLAAGFVPWQQKNAPRYGDGDALARGTLFPGLDLPFMNVANKTNPYAGTPLGELMAIDFVIHELTLYLDTHSDDAEALTVLKNMLALRREGHERYVQQFGPVATDDLESAQGYDWAHAPWPWEYAERQGR